MIIEKKTIRVTVRETRGNSWKECLHVKLSSITRHTNYPVSFCHHLEGLIGRLINISNLRNECMAEFNLFQWTKQRYQNMEVGALHSPVSFYFAYQKACKSPLPLKTTWKLQFVRNEATCMLFHCATPLLRELYGLPIVFGMKCKVPVITYKALWNQVIWRTITPYTFLHRIYDLQMGTFSGFSL